MSSITRVLGLVICGTLAVSVVRGNRKNRETKQSTGKVLWTSNKSEGK